jgi:putative alpha-1,2-mannosidase
MREPPGENYQMLMPRLSVTCALLSVAMTSWSQANPLRPVDYVDPMIGTAPLSDKEYAGGNPVPGEQIYTGTVNPGAMVPDPNGYVCIGPVTGYDGRGGHMRGSGYRFDDTTIMGFTQLNGEYSDVNQLLFMPTVGSIKTSPGSRAEPGAGYRSKRDKLREKASAGYYTVFLTTYGIKVELTATKNCGLHRYTFPAARQANVLIDLANCRPEATDASATIVDKRTVEGFQKSGRNTFYFYAVFNKDFSSSGTWKNGVITPDSPSANGTPLGAYVTFNTSAGEEILVKIGTSTTSLSDAAENLAREIPGLDFDTVRQQTESLWSTIMNRIVLEGGSAGDRTNFYSSIYRAVAGPKYSWFPTQNLGAMILARGAEWTAQKAVGMRWNWGGGYWGPANVSGLVGLEQMGFQNLDLNGNYQKLREQALQGGDAAGAAYRKYGYIPADCGVNDYVNRSIGLSYDDYALAELAKIIGNTNDYRFFLARSKSYTNLYNASVGFFCPRRADGSWILPLDPIEPHAEDIYREGNAWNYLWFQAGDIPELVSLLGGMDHFRVRLDTFFTAPYHPKVPLRDLTGVIGLYFHGNEQYRHIPYLYDYAGQPWKTQAVVRNIEKNLYRPVPAGMCGMDDFGCLTGWYVTSALGFSQVDRAGQYYDIGSPLFPKATIKLEGAHSGNFVIEAHNVSDANMYIQSATLNGKPLNEPRFRQSDIIPSGSLVFEMGPKPNFDWGTDKVATQ